MNEKNTNTQSNQVLNELEWDMAPERDLWPDISSQIKFAQRRRSNQTSERQRLVNKNVFNGPRVAIAACLVMACTAVVLSSMSYYRVQQTHQLQLSYIEYQKAQIALMEQQHAHVRAEFVALLGGEMGDLDMAAATEIKNVLSTFDSASEKLKEAILEQPTNSNYPSKLARTYQQELKLLNKYKEYYKNDKTTI